MEDDVAACVSSYERVLEQFGVSPRRLDFDASQELAVKARDAARTWQDHRYEQTRTAMTDRRLIKERNQRSRFVQSCRQTMVDALAQIDVPATNDDEDKIALLEAVLKRVSERWVDVARSALERHDLAVLRFVEDAIRSRDDDAVEREARTGCRDLVDECADLCSEAVELPEVWRRAAERAMVARDEVWANKIRSIDDSWRARWLQRDDDVHSRIQAVKDDCDAKARLAIVNVEDRRDEQSRQLLLDAASTYRDELQNLTERHRRKRRVDSAFHAASEARLFARCHADRARRFALEACFEARRAGSDQALALCQRDLDDSKTRVRHLESDLSRAEEAKLAMEAQLAHVQGQKRLDDAETNVLRRTYEADLEKLKSEKAQALGDLAAVTKALDCLERRHDAKTSAAANEVKLEREELQQSHREAQTKLADALIAVDRATKERTTLEREIAALIRDRDAVTTAFRDLDQRHHREIAAERNARFELEDQLRSQQDRTDDAERQFAALRRDATELRRRHERRELDLLRRCDEARDRAITDLQPAVEEQLRAALAANDAAHAKVRRAALDARRERPGDDEEPRKETPRHPEIEESPEVVRLRVALDDLDMARRDNDKLRQELIDARDRERRIARAANDAFRSCTDGRPYDDYGDDVDDDLDDVTVAADASSALFFDQNLHHRRSNPLYPQTAARSSSHYQQHIDYSPEEVVHDAAARFHSSSSSNRRRSSVSPPVPRRQPLASYLTQDHRHGSSLPRSSSSSSRGHHPY